MPANSLKIDSALAAHLISTQFPNWAHLPISQVETSGWDNRTFHLGADMTIRLPSGKHYAAAVEKEQTWLPILARHLSMPIPTPLAMGEPSDRYPWHWSVYRWIEGETAAEARANDSDHFALDLALFLNELQRIDSTGGPTGTSRGGTLELWDTQARRAMEVLGEEIDTRLAAEVWEAASRAPITGPPVWYHGDVAAGNLLVCDGRLGAVIDFGGLGVGDPACDTTIGWTYLNRRTRTIFRDALNVDDDVWARGRGWALWKGMIVMAQLIDTNAIEKAVSAYAVSQVLEDYEQGSR